MELNTKIAHAGRRLVVVTDPNLSADPSYFVYENGNAENAGNKGGSNTTNIWVLEPDG